jgi:succinate dehydrogenase / fumarate reductase, cytochrome b subunit
MTTTTSANPPTPPPHDDTGSSGPSRRSLYRGDPGMWSWVLHRITGATVFFFLFVHVLDTALVRISPQAYDEVIDTYKTPIVGLMELALVAAVLYHALNGIRIVLIDFWWQGTRYQRLMLWVIGITWLLVMVPATVLVGLHLFGRFG